ncbi:MAG: FGGY family carbohydrate kinase [Caldilineaceae bacterium]
MTDAPLLLGIDIGTTNLKAIVFDTTGQSVAQAAVRTPTYYPQPGWAYYDAEEIWQATSTALRAVTSQIDARQIVGLAVASYGETGVPLDGTGNPTYHAIAWFDNRTAPQAAWLQAHLGLDAIFAATGCALQPIFTLCKLRWLFEHAPETMARTQRWLNMADYIAYRLCGVAATDFSLASRMLTLDLQQQCWATDLLQAVAIPPALLAPLQPSGTRLGAVLPEVATQTGLPPHAQVAVGGHDHVVGALGLGVTAFGDMLNSIGTAEAIFLPIAQPVRDPEFGSRGYSQGVHAAGGYYALGGLYTSGASVEWFRENFGGSATYADLIAEAEAAPAGSLGAFFLPHLRLANPPYVDAKARGAFIGLRTDVKLGALFRALLEGLAYEVRHSLEPLLQYIRLPHIERIYVAGGGAHNDLYTQVKASVLNHPLHVVSVAESTALGAAVLGGIGAGLYPDLTSALQQLRYAQRVVEPAPTEIAIYEAGYQQVYRQLYGTLRSLHHAI